MGHLPFKDMKILFDLRYTPQPYGPPPDTLEKIIRLGGGEVLGILTDEDHDDDSIINEINIDYIVHYPQQTQHQITSIHSKVIEKNNLNDTYNETSTTDEIVSSSLVSILTTTYFLDKISMKEVDIREYIATNIGKKGKRSIEEVIGGESTSPLKSIPLNNDINENNNKDENKPEVENDNKNEVGNDNDDNNDEKNDSDSSPNKTKNNKKIKTNININNRNKRQRTKKK